MHSNVYEEAQSGAEKSKYWAIHYLHYGGFFAPMDDSWSEQTDIRREYFVS